MQIFLDFDGTIVEHEYPEIGNYAEGCFEVISKLQKAGHKIILNTYRASSRRGKLQKALDYINEIGKNKIKPITEFSKSKINPFYWNWNVFNAFGFIFIDDECIGIPTKLGSSKLERRIVNWSEIDKQFSENGIYAENENGIVNINSSYSEVQKVGIAS